MFCLSGIFLDHPWDPLYQLPFARGCVLSLPQGLSFSPEKYLSSHYFNRTSRAQQRGLGGELVRFLCLLYWENKQACLIYLCFPSR